MILQIAIKTNIVKIISSSKLSRNTQKFLQFYKGF